MSAFAKARPCHSATLGFSRNAEFRELRARSLPPPIHRPRDLPSAGLRPRRGWTRCVSDLTNHRSVNAVGESFFATLKTELDCCHTWPTHRQAKQAVFAFIAGWYNQHRRHSALGNLSPAVGPCTACDPVAA